VIALCVTTARYVRVWQNPATLFAHPRAAWGRPDMALEQLYGNACSLRAESMKRSSTIKHRAPFSRERNTFTTTLRTLIPGRGEFFTTQFGNVNSPCNIPPIATRLCWS